MINIGPTGGDREFVDFILKYKVWVGVWKKFRLNLDLLRADKIQARTRQKPRIQPRSRQQPTINRQNTRTQPRNRQELESSPETARNA